MKKIFRKSAVVAALLATITNVIVADDNATRVISEETEITYCYLDLTKNTVSYECIDEKLYISTGYKMASTGEACECVSDGIEKRKVFPDRKKWKIKIIKKWFLF